MVIFTMSLPTPSIGQVGQAAIDHFLDEVVESKRVPAMFLGVATAKEDSYYGQKGDRVFGHPEKGQVDDHTSEDTDAPCLDLAHNQSYSCSSVPSSSLLYVGVQHHCIYSRSQRADV
jgi:hypothetical protein